MDSSAIALTGILVLVILTLPLGPSWFLVFPVLIGMIALSCDRRRRRSTENQGLPVRAPPPAGDAPAPAPDPAGDAPPPAGDAPPPAGDAPAPAPAPDPAGDAPPPAGDAPAPAPAPDPAGDAPPPAGDAPPPAGDAAGKKRRKPESSSTLSPSSGIEYDVFLSFRGTDTRTTITDHLYNILVSVGISVFKDDEEHPVEEGLPPKINEAIERSRITIAILSRDYLSSKRCLWELVKMLECRKLNGLTIIPIFYDVSPPDLKHRVVQFGRAFFLYSTKFGSDTVTKWMAALREIGKSCGYSGKLYKGYEGQLIEEVAVDVARRLRDADLVAADKLVGIDRHVQEMMRKLGVAYSKGQATEVCGEDVRVIGICGVPGVGKTTLAKVVYDKIRHLFDARIFLPDISSKGVQFSQLMLIADLQIQAPAPRESSGEVTEEIASLCRTKKVLIVLDNVDEIEQIRALAGKLTWFGYGSRIIVTTNKREILSAFNVGADDRGTVEDHEVEPMSYDHALELFRNHAFRRDPPEDVPEYDSLSIEIVKAIGGLPSVIVDHASSLRRNMNKDIWRSTLDSLQNTQKIGQLPFKSVTHEDQSIA